MEGCTKQDFVTLKYENVLLLTHLLLPGICLGSLFLYLEASGLDIWLSNHFYDAIHNEWPYKAHWFVQKVMHRGGSYVFYMLLAYILRLLWQASKTQSPWHYRRKELLYLLMASIAGPIIILCLKKMTHIYCPWDLQLFGAGKPYIRFFDSVASNLPVGHCFPAAHAGSGYTFVSLYYFLLLVRPRSRYYGLAFGLLLGFSFGAAQQLRGAHFLSHDVMSLLVCWYASSLIFLLFFAKQSLNCFVTTPQTTKHLLSVK